MNALEKRTASSLALLYSFRMLGLFMVLPLLALYGADLPGATPALIGLALGIYGLSQAVLQVPFGWLSDKIGRKPVILAGLTLFALGSLVAGMAETVEGLVVGRFLQGSGAIAGTVMALLADLTRDEQRTKAMAIVGISIGMSFALALIIGPIVAASAGLSGVFYFTAILALAGIAIVLFVVPTPSVPQNVEVRTDSRFGPLISSLSNGRLLRLNFGVFVLHFILMASFLMVPGVLEGVLGVDRDAHWQVYLPVLLLSVLGMLPLMRIAEKGGRPRQMFILSIIVLLVSVMLVSFARLPLPFYCGLWLFFVGFNYLEATLPSLVSKSVASDGRGAAMGMFSTCQFLGAFVGGALGGWVLQAAGAIALVTVCLAMVTLWLLVSLPTKQAVVFDSLNTPDA